MKQFLIPKYYNFLMWLEDVFGGIESIVNDHRKWIDKKYYFQYIAPKTKIETTKMNKDFPAIDNIYRHFK